MLHLKFFSILDRSFEKLYISSAISCIYCISQLITRANDWQNLRLPQRWQLRVWNIRQISSFTVWAKSMDDGSRSLDISLQIIIHFSLLERNQVKEYCCLFTLLLNARLFMQIREYWMIYRDRLSCGQYDSAPRPPLPLHRKTEKERQLADGRGGK